MAELFFAIIRCKVIPRESPGIGTVWKNGSLQVENNDGCGKTASKYQYDSRSKSEWNPLQAQQHLDPRTDRTQRAYASQEG